MAVGSSSTYQYDSYIYFGNGDGTFQTLKKVANSSTLYPQFLDQKIADLNGDGRDDILSSDTGTTIGSVYPNIYVGLSNGDGTFQTVVTKMPFETIQGGIFNAANSSPALADFDHDGRLDAAFGSISNLYVLKGHGDGSFDSPGTALPIPSLAGTRVGTAAVATGDFDGDGNLDIAVLYVIDNLPLSNQSVYINDSAVFVYYGAGDGTFSAPVIAEVSAHPYTMITASDLNGDGLADILLRADGLYQDTSFGILHALPGRTFAPEVNYTAGTGHYRELAALDVNRDGLPDLLMTNNLASSVTVLLNLGNTPTVTGTLTATPEPSLVNQPFTITATLYPPQGSAATRLSGSVTFSIDGNAIGSSPVASNAASFSVNTPLTRGTHQLTATWSGDTNYSGITLSGTHTVTGYPVTLSITAAPNPAVFGQQIGIKETVSNSPSTPASIPAPSGTLTTTDNGASLGSPVSFTNGVSSSLTYSHDFSVAGQHTLTATYSGDSLHEPATATLIETVNPIATTTSLQSAPNPSTYGQPVTLTASVTALTGNPLGTLFSPPATVTFTGLPNGPLTIPVIVNTAASSSALTVATATYTTNKLPAGSYTITATYSGNTNTLTSTSPAITQVVQPGPTTTTLTVNPTTAYPTQTVTLSAHVTGALGAPTGTIQLLDGATPLASVPLTSGNATFATTQLGVGTHAITVVYNGDTNNLSSTSSSVTVTILPSDFTLSLDPPTISLVTGHHTTLHLTATSVGIFADTVHLSVSALPQWVTVNFTPADLQLTSGAKATASIYLDTDAVIGYLSQARPVHRPLSCTSGTAATLALILAPLTLRRRRRLAALLSLAIAAALLAGATGCSGKYPDSTPPGTYNLQITATGTHTGLTHTITLPLTVTK